MKNAKQNGADEGDAAPFRFASRLERGMSGSFFVVRWLFLRKEVAFPCVIW